MQLLLRGDGTAALEIAVWWPGESDNPTLENYKGSWSSVGNEVTLNLGDEVVVLEYHPQLWFAEFGREGLGPGLRGLTSTFEARLLVGRTFWFEPALKALPELPLD